MTTQQEIDSLTWHNAINKLKSILKKLITKLFTEAPIDGRQYARKDGEWDIVASGGGGVQSVTGYGVVNSDPLNPIVDIINASAGGKGLMTSTDYKKLNEIPYYANNIAARAILQPGMFYTTDNGLGDLLLKVVTEAI